MLNIVTNSHMNVVFFSPVILEKVFLDSQKFSVVKVYVVSVDGFPSKCVQTNFQKFCKRKHEIRFHPLLLCDWTVIRWRPFSSPPKKKGAQRDAPVSSHNKKCAICVVFHGLIQRRSQSRSIQAFSCLPRRHFSSLQFGGCLEILPLNFHSFFLSTN